MNEIKTTIANQINIAELNMARFLIMQEGDNKIIVKKGVKYVTIEYDNSRDTYIVIEGSYSRKTFETKEEKTEDVYADMLRPIIEEHFKFEYVMDRIMAARC